MDKDTWTRKDPVTPLDVIIQQEALEKKFIRKWKVIAYISAAGFLLSLGINLYSLYLPKSVPVLIQVSDWGESKYIGSVEHLSYQGLKIPDVCIEYQLRKFITNRFSIPGDAAVLKQNLTDCYSCLTAETAAKLSNEFKENNPMKTFSDEKRQTVEIESVLKLGGDNYQIDFFVTYTDKYYSRKATVRYRGILSIGLLEPAKEDQILNPLGIYIRNYDFSEIKQ